MASTDTFQPYTGTLAGPYRHGAAVTPSDTADLDAVSRAIYVGSSANLAVVTAGAASTTETVTFTSIGYGSLPPYRVSRALITGSSGTKGIISLR